MTTNTATAITAAGGPKPWDRPGRPGGGHVHDTVNGLEMYYEVHGSGRPLVLLHGNLSTIGIDFGGVLPELAKRRRIIAVEQQGHGRTADIDWPLSIDRMADDTAALLRELKVDEADFFGYSSGTAVAMRIAVRHPDLVGRLVLASASYSDDGLYPGILDGIDQLTPEDLAGSPYEREYARVAPRPEDWPRLIEKVKRLDREVPQWTPDEVRAIAAPVLLIAGDADIIRPEHIVEMFRLLGGGVAGDLEGLPDSRLAILPGTTHFTLVRRADWLASMVIDFLDLSLIHGEAADSGGRRA